MALEMKALETVLDYHQRTKHHPDRYARSMGFMDWENQPERFRSYQGASRLGLDLPRSDAGPLLDQLGRPGSVKPQPLDHPSLSRLLYDSLALSAWKSTGGDRWALRCNPSSGNLHPTEGYLICGPVTDLTDTPGLYHYDPLHHALERRVAVPDAAWARAAAALPPAALLVGLSSIHWREVWKYGERGFRYCQHDVGHAMAALSYAAAALGWQAQLLGAVSDAQLEQLLGIADQQGPEREHADCLLALYPQAELGDPPPLACWQPPAQLLEALETSQLAGRPNHLSPSHHDWPVIQQVTAAAARVDQPGDPGAQDREACVLPLPPDDQQIRAAVEARLLFRSRRSATQMDPRRSMPARDFFRLLQRLLAHRHNPPLAVLGRAPAIHLLLFVHRVEGLESGLYLLLRDPGDEAPLRRELSQDMSWEELAQAPAGLPLYRMEYGDLRQLAGAVSCRQRMAGDGVFAVSMLARFGPSIEAHPWIYRQLFWEAGALGQVLYLEAEAAGLRGTGIGCFFDDVMHDLLGLSGQTFQVLYHFTVGGALNDDRLSTLEAYHHLDRG